MILLVKKWILLATLCGLATIIFIAIHIFFLSAHFVVPASLTTQHEKNEPMVAVIDPGHGGEDGGAVSIDGVPESQINLAISLRLEQILRFMGIRTDMTRREDEMVCAPGLSTLRQRKVSDIQNRVWKVNEQPGAILLSVHQNSLPSSTATHGAQVFWNQQEGADVLARVMQECLNTVVNTHRAKDAREIPNSIYLMKNVTRPAVLVECGFLSNQEETAILQTSAYQLKLAVTIGTGLLRWRAGEEIK